MQNWKIVFVVNSYIDRPGNIGLRVGKVIDKLEELGIPSLVISRGGRVGSEFVRVENLPAWFGLVARMFNAVRIYANKNFRSRLFDIKIFEWLVNRKMEAISRFVREGKGVVHLVESSPELVRVFQRAGYVVILDVPIAPASFVVNQFFLNKKIDGFSDVSYLVPLERKAFELADRIVVPSIFVKNCIEADGMASSKIMVIPFGTDVGDRRFSRSVRKDSALKACFAGVVGKRKGVDVLLDAWAKVCDQSDTLFLCGRLTPHIKAAISNLGKKVSVLAPGFVQVEEFFQTSDLYVFPSYLEGSSKSIYEAMAHGLAVITTFESGSVVEDGVSGLIVAAGSVDELAAAIARLKADRELLLSLQKGAFDAVKKFTWSKYAHELIEQYKEIGNA
ncbi:glycosyltransferase family 4 protein [Teredinibacter turnerae]|uniref:glycosyltransferase family 4 protein n=1 Tax=Teredinibacter turnerae TaxID=2426 RepID=UPI000373B1AA|nr:glycosyltransferase family 4 protein [Teredinibacter turnerae]